jgi:hypothetical protein
MYSLRQIKKGFRDPLHATDVLTNRFSRTSGSWLNSVRGERFLDRDWDNLVLLDACRYDLFRAENTIDGRLSPVRSNASSSDEFFAKNIEGRAHGDLVYYSANPHIDNVDASFHDLYRLWEGETWDEETGTVLPGDAVDKVIDTADEYDDKRLILHMMQPHRPFLGERAADFEQTGFARTGVTRAPGEDPEVAFWWHRLEDGKLDKKQVMRLYRGTLRVALPHVQRLVNSLPGKTVVSADHGNVFGDRGMFGQRLYGHPSDTHHPKLVTVPWLEIDKPRKNIVEGTADVQSKREHFTEAAEQLEALGYVE